MTSGARSGLGTGARVLGGALLYHAPATPADVIRQLDIPCGGLRTAITTIRKTESHRKIAPVLRRLMRAERKEVRDTRTHPSPIQLRASEASAAMRRAHQF